MSLLKKKSQPELNQPGESLAAQARRAYLTLLTQKVDSLTQEILAVLMACNKSIAEFERDQATAKRRLEAQRQKQQAQQMQTEIGEAGQGLIRAEAAYNKICGECEQKVLAARRARDAAADEHRSALSEQGILQSKARGVLWDSADPGIGKRINILVSRRNGLIERAMLMYRCQQADPRVRAETQPVNDEIARLEALRLDPLGGLFVEGTERDEVPAARRRSVPEYPTQFQTGKDMARV